MDIKLQYFNILKQAIERAYVDEHEKLTKVADLFYDTIQEKWSYSIIWC